MRAVEIGQGEGMENAEAVSIVREEGGQVERRLAAGTRYGQAGFTTQWRGGRGIWADGQAGQ